MAVNDIWEFLARLEQKKICLKIEDEVDPVYEISAVLKKVGQAGGPPVMFENVKGFDMPVVGNLFAMPETIAVALECEVGEIYDVFHKRRNELVQPRFLEGEAPCQKVVYRDQDVDITSLIPVLTYHEKDASPYFTAGIVIIKDPNSQAQSFGIHRIQLKDSRSIRVQLVSHTSTIYLERAEKLGKGAEMAVVLAPDPCTTLASIAWSHHDKFQLAGGLRRAPLEVCKALTSDIILPAHSAIVLEGRFLPDVREEEGPFGESTGYYITSKSPVAEINLISMMERPVYPVCEPWTREDELMISLGFSREIVDELRKTFPGVKNVKLSSMVASCVVSLQKKTPGEARRLICNVLTMNPYIKYVTVVDDDVDVNNPMEVEWAMTTRMLPDTGIIRIDGLDGSPIDPTVKLDPNLLTTKIGFDATKPLGYEEQFTKIDVPSSAHEKAQQVLKKVGWLK